MPLYKTSTDRAFKHNVKVEYKVLRKKGLSKKAATKQATAIAYSIKRRAKRKGKGK